MIPVSWGNGRFLGRIDRMPEICEDIAELGAPREYHAFYDQGICSIVIDYFTEVSGNSDPAVIDRLMTKDAVIEYPPSYKSPATARYLIAATTRA